MLDFNLDTRKNSLTTTKMHGVTEARLDSPTTSDRSAWSPKRGWWMVAEWPAPRQLVTRFGEFRSC
jgi:hypothetical protein